MKTVEIFSTVETDFFLASRSRSRSRSRRDKSRPPSLLIIHTCTEIVLSQHTIRNSSCFLNVIITNHTANYFTLMKFTNLTNPKKHRFHTSFFCESTLYLNKSKLPRNCYVIRNIVYFRRFLRETLKMANAEDLNRLTSCSLVLLGHIFLSLGNSRESMNMVTPAMQLASKIPDAHVQLWASSILKG